MSCIIVEVIPSESGENPLREPISAIVVLHFHIPSSSSGVIPDVTFEILSKISFIMSAEITSPGFKSISSSTQVIAKELIEKKKIKKDKYFIKSPIQI